MHRLEKREGILDRGRSERIGCTDYVVDAQRLQVLLRLLAGLVLGAINQQDRVVPPVLVRSVESVNKFSHEEAEHAVICVYLG